MDLVVVGDVHACFYSFQKLVKQHWDPKRAMLIQLGDLVNKGPFTSRCIDYMLRLMEAHPDRVVWLKGNHEYILHRRFQDRPKSESMLKLSYALKKRGREIEEVMRILADLPLSYETDRYLISHAGFSKHNSDPHQLESPFSLINNRGPLAALDKVQLVGHNVVEGNKPVFSTKENAWYLDTGAWSKKYLSGLYIKDGQEVVKVIRQAVDPADQPDF